MFIETLLSYTAALALCFLCGYGLTALLPAQVREYRYFAMPTLGYAVYCFIVYSGSGSTGIPVSILVWIAFAFLVALSVVVWATQRPRETPRQIILGIARALVLA